VYNVIEMEVRKVKKYKPYLAFVAATLAVGGLAAWIVSDSGSIYEKLLRPPLSPPSVVFPIVWTILYILMGLAAALVYTAEAGEKYEALRLYAIQLAVNFLWPLIFFGTQKFLFALIWLAVLFLLVAILTNRFGKIRKSAGFLIIPYLVWTAFALYLNTGVYLMN